MDAMQQQQMALELKRRKEQYRLRLENALKRMDQEPTVGVDVAEASSPLSG